MWLGLVWLAACSGSREPIERGTSDPNVPVDGDSLVWAVPFDPGNLNSLVAPYALSGMIEQLVTPGLAGRKMTDKGLTFEPILAESWTWGDDGLSLTYTLREGLVWEDGTPLTSADVAFTHELTADPAVASNWHGDAKHIAGVDAIDDRTVRFRFTGRRNPILQQGYTFRGIVPKHVLKDADRATLRGHPSARQPLASGPFRLHSWKSDDMLVLVPNPKAPKGDKPHLNRIIVRVLPEYSTRLIELERGNIDLLSDVEIADLSRIEKHPDLRLVRMEANSMQYIGYNLTKPVFQDLRVRKALTHASDRERLIDDLLSADGKRYGQPCVGTVGPTLGDWFNPDIKPLPYDPAAARALLDEAGWVDSDGDGIRDKDGQPLRFKLLVQNGYAVLKRIAVLTQAQWKEVGVDMQLDIIEPTRFALLAREKKFDAILWSFGSNPKVDPSIKWKTDGQYNWFGYSDPEVDRLLDEGVSATDIQESQRAFRKVQKRVHDAQPATFLFWSDEVAAVHVRFKGSQMDTFTLLRHAEDWYVPKQDQLRR